MNDQKESEDSPLIGIIQDDSGYQTNTPLSSEQRRSNESFPAYQTAISANSNKATPVGAISKFERVTYNGFKKWKRVLATRVTSLKQGNTLADSAAVAIAGSQAPNGDPVRGSRKRLHSMPNLLANENYSGNLANGKWHLNRASKRLLSIGANEDLLMYQGWISLNSNESGLTTLEKLDFIEKLGKERHLMEIAVQILDYLEPEDLVAASKVSKFWKLSINSNKILSLKLKNFSLEKKTELQMKVANKENAGAGVVVSVGRRGSCIDIKNVVMETKETKGSGGRFELESATIKEKFAEMARQNGKWLCFCPKCSHPAQLENCDTIAQCLRAECNYYFCSRCLFKPHCGKECSTVEQDTPTKLVIGGKKSKKNLRRL